MFIGIVWIIVTFCGCRSRSTEPRSLEIKTSLVIDPPSGVHERTVIYLHGLQASVQEQYALLRSKGFLVGMDDNIRVVAPQIAKTSRNRNIQWFPFLVDPAVHTEESLASVSELNWSMEVLLPILDSEAARLGGDFSKIFIFGYSQGAMMGIWTGLMGNRPLGGVVSYAGCLPVSELNKVSVLGRKIPIVHFHDPRDNWVLFEHAVRGLQVAQQAGAEGYKSVREVEINGGSHHGLSGPAIKLVNQELARMMHVEHGN